MADLAPPDSPLGPDDADTATTVDEYWFATCPKGLEGLLAEELRGLGADTVKETVAGCHFSGPIEMAYRACGWSRFAAQVLVPIGRYDCKERDALYEGAREIPWFDHIDAKTTFSISYSGRVPGIDNTQFGAQRVKDALVDVCRDHYGERPSVVRDNPDLRLYVRVHRGIASVSVSLAGESLHRRGYRLGAGPAPLKENLAAALVSRVGWNSASEGMFLDPMCGSGTIVVEAALAALDIPAGYLRRRWGFQGWLGHVPAVWSRVEAQMRDAAHEGLAGQTEIVGWDANSRAVEIARQNIAAAGLAKHIRIERAELATTELPADAGTIVTNPPYGERIGDAPSLVPIYESMGERIERSTGWRAGVFTANPDLARAMGISPVKQYRLWNGPLPARLLVFESGAGDPRRRRVRPDDEAGPREVALSAGAQMFANRIAKRDKQLQKWARQNDVECYRIYDADLPEYAVAVDRYADWVHVSEYRAPASVDPAVAKRRLNEVILAIPSTLGVSSDKVVIKRRERQRGNAQYTRRARNQEVIKVREGPATLLVNLRDYLDTGLFLDHRPVRLKIGELAQGKRFLNLFCYTATATVHAALGGARMSMSVDTSNTYLEWARRNLKANQISHNDHRLSQADCLEWLAGGDGRYDVILLDPPTFSNSKRTEATLDVQRDHAMLIDAASRRLSRTGVLIFSTNRRQFVLDPEISERYAVEEATHWSVPKDFERARNKHRCWLVRHAGDR